MQVRVLLPDSKSLRVDCIEVDAEQQTVCIAVSSSANGGKCPQCQRFSQRIHSKYLRKLSDLPWQGSQVRIAWQSRKFFCDANSCGQRIFTERLPEVAAAHARRSARLGLALRCLAFACGGEEGARLADRLGMAVSPDTLLREIRRTDIPKRETPKALGVDDWAFRKGKRYGTILVDLEKGHAVELLPERSAESVSKWLQDHPGAEIISRDRGDCYIKGATEGAPDATQVADRFHLVQNMREAIVRLLDKYSKQVQLAVKDLREECISSNRNECDEPPVTPDSKSISDGRTTAVRRKRSNLYESVIALHEQGVSNREIARRTGIHRGTVNKYIREGLQERASRSYPSDTDQCIEILYQRWNEGCRNAKQLTREIQEKGYDVSYWSVRRRITHWRKAANQETKKIPATLPKPSSNKVSWLLLKDESNLSNEEKSLKQVLIEKCDGIKSTLAIASEFLSMVRNLSGHKFSNWLERATASTVPIEFRRFAEGLKKDLAAVSAALTLRWNNGSSEGHINRLKMVKRQMYGRANFDLLRKRFLYKAA